MQSWIADADQKRMTTTTQVKNRATNWMNKKELVGVAEQLELELQQTIALANGKKKNALGSTS